jgi:hypothetical protein
LAPTLLEAGTDLHTIQLLLGHTHLEDTTVYLHLSQQQLHTAINPLDQVTIRSYAEARPGEATVWQCPRCHGPMRIVERLTAFEIRLKQSVQVCACDSS